ncbi:hypothetical protein IC229_22565, partial [Spirosoma sp. BT702]
GLVTSLKAGNWNDPTVWACNVVPASIDIVQLNHVVTLWTYYLLLDKKLGHICLGNYGKFGNLTPPLTQLI